MDIYTLLVFPGDSVGKESACNAGDMNSIPRSGSFPGGRHDNPLHCSCLENPMEWGAWWTIVHRWQRVGQDWSNWAHIYSLLDIYTHRGLPGGWAIKSCLQCRRHSWCRFNPWIRKIPWNMKWQSTPVLLPGNSTDRGTWQVTVHGITKGQLLLSNWACKHRYMWIQIQI